MEANVDRCKYVYVRGLKRGQQCLGTIHTKGFCVECLRKYNATLQLEQGYFEPCVKDEIIDPNRGIIIESDPITGFSVADVTKLNYMSTLGELCNRIPAKQLYNEIEKYCQYKKTEEIIIDLTAAAQYIGRLSPKLSDTGFDPIICVIDKYNVGCQYGIFSIQLHQAGSWNHISSFMIKKNSIVTDTEALASIMWHLTYKEWNNDFIEWLDIKVFYY